jgi:hypothetical protein
MGAEVVSPDDGGKEITMHRYALAFVFVVLCCACTTRFYGDPKIEGGPLGCVTKCGQWNMDLAGMVAMGEYSEACICQVRGKQASLTPAVLGAVAAVDTAARVQQQNAAAAATTTK